MSATTLSPQFLIHGSAIKALSKWHESKPLGISNRRYLACRTVQNNSKLNFGKLPGLKRQPAQSLPSRREDRTRPRPRNRRPRRPAASTGRFVARHDVNFYAWHIVDAHHRVIIEIALLRLATLDRDFIEQRRGQSEHKTALHLRLHHIRIDHLPTINRANDAIQLHAAIICNRHFGDVRQIGAPSRYRCNSAPATLWQRRSPAGFFRREIEDMAQPRYIHRRLIAAARFRLRLRSNQSTPQLERIFARGGGDLIDEALHHEVVPGGIDTAPVPAWHARVQKAELKQVIRNDATGQSCSGHFCAAHARKAAAAV